MSVKNVKTDGRSRMAMNVMIGLALLSQLADRMEPGNSRVPFPCGVLGADEQRERLETVVGGVGARDHGRQLDVVPILDVGGSYLHVGSVSCIFMEDESKGI